MKRKRNLKKKNETDMGFAFQDIYEKAMEFLPIISETGGGLKNILPYSSIMFFVGLAFGTMERIAHRPPRSPKKGG